MRSRILVLLLAALPAVNGTAASAQFDELAVKAAALVNVARFVQWPGPEALASPFVIAVAGDAAVVDAVAEIVQGRRLQERDVHVRRLGEDETACACQVLFVAAEEDGRSAALLESVGADAVLTVGETPAFLRAGGLIRLFREDDRLRLQISTKSASQSPLRISSRLLRLSGRVQ